ncbi:hypothetical protein O3P69_013859 [Scylla paramamosain]|uniref:Uncharacterized protein n=1 Tax=Scylla paramamosain TaxID=85552 RepID=A0AAW0SRI5_SCYPA
MRGVNGIQTHNTAEQDGTRFLWRSAPSSPRSPPRLLYHEKINQKAERGCTGRGGAGRGEGRAVCRGAPHRVAAGWLAGLTASLPPTLPSPAQLQLGSSR